MKVVEEYLWAIMLAVGCSFCGWSVSIVL